MHELYLQTSDGTKIACNHYDDNREACLIIAPGWYMCKDAGPFMRMSDVFFDQLDVITMDFRGHGRSSGLFTFTAREEQDIAAVVSYAKDRYEKVALMGFSLGAATSILHCSANTNIDALIAISPPSNVYKIENQFWRPSAFINTMKKHTFKERRNVRVGNIFLPKTKPIDVITRMKTPSLFIAGSDDPTVYAWHTEALHRSTIAPLKKLEVFEKAHHAEDLFLKHPERFTTLCNEWLETHLI